MAKRVSNRSRDLSNTENDMSFKDRLKQISKNVANKIGGAVTDFTTLEVTTLTGEVSHSKIKSSMSKETLNENDNSNTGKESMYKISLEEILEEKESKNIQLVAHTKVHFDHDTINFVSSNSDHKELFPLHLDAIRAANDGRNGFLGLLQKAIV